MQMLLLLQANLTIASESDFAKVYTNPEGHFTLIADIELTQTEPSEVIFKGIIDGFNHTITVKDDLLIFESIDGALFRDLNIIVGNSHFAIQMSDSTFKDVHFTLASTTFDSTESCSFISCSFTFGEASAIRSSKMTHFNGILSSGKSPLMELSENDVFGNSFFSTAVELGSATKGYGAVADRMQGSTLIKTKVNFSVDGSATVHSNLIGGIAATGMYIKINDVDVYAHFDLKSKEHLGGMFANLEKHDSDRSY